MPASLLWIVAFALLAGTLLLCQQLFCHYVYDVRLGDMGVEVVILKRIAVFHVPYDEIASIEKVSVVRAIFSFALGLVNRPFGEYILLHRTRGLFRRILVTPASSGEFYDALLSR